MKELTKDGEQLLYLISCALSGGAVKEEFLEGVDFSKLFALARSHTVSAMVCMALERTEVFAQADPAVRKQWREAKDKAIRKNLLLDTEREIMMNEMENAGIWHMPLKGSILKDWYPQYGMREMADNDILFDGAKREQVKELFLKHGYSAEKYDKSNHDVYHKPPVYNFEMHVSLFNNRAYADLAEKYRGVKEKLLPDENKKYRFHFTPEDFYAFVTVHAYKHYSHSGTGIRTLADTYVMNHKIGESLDWSYVENELEALGIGDYEKRSRRLSEKIFGQDKPVSEIALTAEEQEMLLYHLGASTYGNLGNRVNNRLRSMQMDSKPISGFTKFKYCAARLFPGRKWCKNYCPFVYKHPYLLPAFWVWRLFKRIPGSRKKVQKELSALKSSK